MKSSRLFSFKVLLTAFVSCLFFNGMAINPTDTRLLQNPAVSANQIAFIYAEDLWIADKDGSNPRRLTVDEGIESNPVFSPDGSMIAFNAEYDGNVDVFVVASIGGVPKRLTWHPYTDIVKDFSNDGKRVLFTSQRNVFTGRFTQLFTVAVEGGRVEQLPIPWANHASYSPDGKFIAYTPLRDVFSMWKHYRGGTATRIWIYNTADHSVVEIPKPEGGSNDTDPQWMGDYVYFRSDRNGEFNLFSYNVNTKAIDQLTSFSEFPVQSFSANGGRIIFEQAGYLHSYDTGNNNSQKLTVGIAADLLELRPRFVSGARYIRSAGISPSGARAVFDFRGDIITVPAEKGDPRNITLTTGIHEKFPQWSPDGKQIAYFSDASGEYALHVRNQDGNLHPKIITLNGAGFYAYLHWSPDSKKIAYVDNARNLYLADVASGVSVKIATDELYYPGTFRELFGSWSHDSRWLAYTIIIGTNYEQAFVYSLEQNKSFALSDGLSNVTSPVFDPSGKYIYMLASTDAGPVVNWFDQSNQDMEMTNSIYLVTLQKDLPSPLAKENDVEKPKEPKSENKDEKSVEAVAKVIIDWDGIQNRIISLPIRAGNYSNLQLTKEGQLFYLADPPFNSGPTALRKYDLLKREDKEIMQADWYQIAGSGEKMLYRQRNNWGIVKLGEKPEGNLNIEAIQVKIDPSDEWTGIFAEAWRMNRDYFYDPGMHGVDWPAMKKKYEVFLPDIACRSDLYRVMEWMGSEMAVGHHRFSSRGDRMANPETISGGLLGADYEVANGRYRFRKIYGGLNWTPELRSPLTEPGVNVNIGEYLLAVNGKDVSANQNLYSFFENTADKITEITVGPNPGYEGSRKVNVVPLTNEFALRNRDWVEGNLRKVDAATNGRVAYVYVPNTAGSGHEYFKRYFFPQANKKAIIIDERFNGGGQLADYYIDMLKKPLQSYWNFRYGNDLKAPSASIQGPKVMLIDENAGSGGDYLPWMFRKFKVGTLIGKTTWGGLVGVLGYPEFIDGGIMTAPNVAFWDEYGFGIENVGVPPDIEIEQWPKDVINGKDPQLEKAIEVILQQLQEDPPKEPVRPPYPVRVKNE